MPVMVARGLKMARSRRRYPLPKKEFSQETFEFSRKSQENGNKLAPQCVILERVIARSKTFRSALTSHNHQEIGESPI